MYLSNKFFRFLFGVSGTRTSVPDATDPSGYVSYEEGYPADYSLPSSNPSRKPVERDKANQIYYDLTSGIKQYQEYGIPEWIAAADNGGSAKSYAKDVRVLYTADAGVTWNVYESLVNSNTATPGTDPTKWALYTRTQGVPYASSGGTADAITATFSPAFTALTDITGVMVRASAANTSASPTINIDGLGAKTIYKGANTSLVAGDIAGAGFWMFLKYDATLDKFILLNPQYSASAVSSVLSSALSTSSVQTIAHGLGRIPKNVSCAIVPQSTIAGWSSGDEISRWVDGLSSVADTSISVGADATNIYVVCGSVSNVAILNRATGAASPVAVSNFKVKVYYE